MTTNTTSSAGLLSHKSDNNYAEPQYVSRQEIKCKELEETRSRVLQMEKVFTHPLKLYLVIN